MNKETNAQTIDSVDKGAMLKLLDNLVKYRVINPTKLK